MYYFLAYYRLTKLNIRFIRYLLALTGVFLFPLPPPPQFCGIKKLGIFSKNN
jgi:hypothetical protein